MTTAEVIAGQFSPLGKATDRSLQHLRSHVEATEVSLRKSQSQPNGFGAQKIEEKPTPRASASTLLSSKLRQSKGQPVKNVQSTPKSELSHAMTSRWLASVTEEGAGRKSKLLEGATLGGSGLSLPRVETVHEQPAFTSLNHDSEVYCEHTRAVHKRYVAPAKHEPKPELGARDITDTLLHLRTPGVDLSNRNRSRSVKPRERNTGTELGDTWSSFSTGAASNWAVQDQMDMSIARPGIVEAARMNMTFAPDHYRDWCTMDAQSSMLQRPACWDLKKHSQGHKVEKWLGFESEPGKYDVKSPQAKSGTDFSKALSHSPISSSKGFWPAPSMLLPEKEPDPPDRSNFRGCQATRPEPTCPDLGKAVERPPLIPKAEVPYDEDDPSVSAAVWKRQMTFDASSADRFIIPRQDHSPEMRTCMPRANAKKGTKIVQDDLLEYWCAGGLSVTSNDFADEKASKDLRSWPRTDLGRSFDQVHGREQPALIGSPKMEGRLARPKDSAPFDFIRTMPDGFTSRAKTTSVSPTRFIRSSNAAASRASPQRRRKHEALPGWDYASFDEAECKPLPGQ